MPLRRTKTYQVVTAAGAASTRPVPENPKRVGFVIQNTGANPGLLRFGAPVASNGSDLTIAAGDRFTWNQADTCPLESMNFASTLTTTWCVMEIVGGEGANG